MKFLRSRAGLRFAGCLQFAMKESGVRGFFSARQPPNSTHATRTCTLTQDVYVSAWKEYELGGGHPWCPWGVDKEPAFPCSLFSGNMSAELL